MTKVIKNLSLIAAIGQNYELGSQNDLIWRIKEDLQFFKSKTMNSYIIMGRKTYDSIPPLKNRKYIVLSNSLVVPENDILVFRNIDEIRKFVLGLNEEVFVIGGAEIYRQFIENIQTMYLTEIEAKYDKADVYFPSFDKSEWERERSETLENNGLKYSHNKYKRKMLGGK